MVKAHYDLHLRLKAKGAVNIQHYMEVGFLQDMLLQEYNQEADTRTERLYVLKDERKKPNKELRVENLTVLFERNLIYFADHLQANASFTEFKQQLLGFPNANHDDGPDALEGAIFILDQKIKLTNNPMTFGGQRRNNRY